MKEGWHRATTRLALGAVCFLFDPSTLASATEEERSEKTVVPEDVPVPVEPVYVPPRLDAPESTVGASGRGGPSTASLSLLAPDHLALTTLGQPTLYWYLAQPSTTPIEVTLGDRTTVKPLLEIQVPLPAQAGVHALRLADHGVRLTAGVDYRWFVSIVRNPERRSEDVTVSAWIRRQAPSESLRERLALAAPRGREAFVYAENGFWYDAIESVSARIDAAPRDSLLRAQRAALLDQVQRSDVAAWDRSHAPGP